MALKPALASERKGKLVPMSARLSDDLRSRLIEAASQNGRSLSAEIEALLEAAVMRTGRN